MSPEPTPSSAAAPDKRKPGLVIYGASRLAHLMYTYFTTDSNCRVCGFTVDREYMNGDEFCGLPVVLFEDVVDRFPPGLYRLFVAVGYRRMRDRQAMFTKAKDKGYALENYISSKAIVSGDVTMGENNVLMAGVIVEPSVVIGNNNLFWSQSLVCHEAMVGDHNYIAARCVVAGGAVIGNLCFLGNGAVTINDLKVADETHVLPGSVLYRNTRPFTKYMGTPANAIGEHQEDGIVVTRG